MRQRATNIRKHFLLKDCPDVLALRDSLLLSYEPPQQIPFIENTVQRSIVLEWGL